MKGAGPRFGGASLSVRKVEMMNTVNGGQCRVNGAKHENFNVPDDDQGNSILTGDGKEQKDEEKKFTLAAIETFAI